MLDVKLYCPKHPRFNPLSGEEAIKGGCHGCYRLMAMAEEVRKWKMSLEKFYGYGPREERAERQRKAELLLSRARTVVTKVREDEELNGDEERLIGAI
jgi:protein gp37